MSNRKNCTNQIEGYDQALRQLEALLKWAEENAGDHPDMPGKAFRAALGLALVAFDNGRYAADRLEEMHHMLRHVIEGINERAWQREAMDHDEDETPVPDWLAARLARAEQAVKGLGEPRTF